MCFFNWKHCVPSASLPGTACASQHPLVSRKKKNDAVANDIDGSGTSSTCSSHFCAYRYHNVLFFFYVNVYRLAQLSSLLPLLFLTTKYWAPSVKERQFTQLKAHSHRQLTVVTRPSWPQMVVLLEKWLFWASCSLLKFPVLVLQ